MFDGCTFFPAEQGHGAGLLVESACIFIFIFILFLWFTFGEVSVRAPTVSSILSGTFVGVVVFRCGFGRGWDLRRES